MAEKQIGIIILKSIKPKAKRRLNPNNKDPNKANTTNKILNLPLVALLLNILIQDIITEINKIVIRTAYDKDKNWEEIDPTKNPLHILWIIIYKRDEIHKM
jgi:hypothetical protein